MNVLVTGASGFIAGYLIEELLSAGYQVVGLDNHSKYGPVDKSYNRHPRYRLVEGDAKDVGLVADLLADCDHFVPGAAMIGGISYFHEFAYDLLAENERLTAAAFDAALQVHRRGRLRKITVMSSSMVFESTREFPTPEGAELRSPPPLSTYGFQKLATEFYARGALQQYGMPFTIIRPFNCIGIGESRAVRDSHLRSGNIELAMSHVVPDLVQKVIKGQDPLHVLGNGGQVRHYTYGGDLARGIRICLEHPAALNNDFNISTAQATTVLELASLIWCKVRRNEEPLRWISDPPFFHDVQIRSPDTSKACELLGFQATTSLSAALDEVIPWVQEQVAAGRI
ncbi:MAG: NAD-dependent epimerase/dehydratase family protein [Terriglobales bacterium]